MAVEVAAGAVVVLGGAGSAWRADDDSPARELRLASDSAGRRHEVVVLHFDSGNKLVIHARKARRQNLDLLD